MKRWEVWTDRGLQSEWMRQPCTFLYIALHPGLCHVFTGCIRIRQFWNLARDDVTNPWLLIRQRNPWNFWPQVLELSPAFHFCSSYRQGTTHILREERGRWLLPSYIFVNLFVIYTGDPRRSNGDQPPVDHGLFLWEVIWGIMTSSFCFTTVLLVLVCVKLLNFPTLIEELPI